jgi:hypothetical protein
VVETEKNKGRKVPNTYYALSLVEHPEDIEASRNIQGEI